MVVCGLGCPPRGTRNPVIKNMGNYIYAFEYPSVKKVFPAVKVGFGAWLKGVLLTAIDFSWVQG